MKKQKNKTKQTPQAAKVSVPSTSTKKRTWAIYDFPEEVSDLAREMAHEKGIKVAVWVEEAVKAYAIKDNESVTTKEICGMLDDLQKELERGEEIILDSIKRITENYMQKSWWRFW